MKKEYRCLKCGRPIDQAINKTSQWTAPKDALVFSATNSFGSKLYDLAIENLLIEIIVCDDCIKANQRYFNIVKK